MRQEGNHMGRAGGGGSMGGMGGGHSGGGHSMGGGMGGSRPGGSGGRSGGGHPGGSRPGGAGGPGGPRPGGPGGPPPGGRPPRHGWWGGFRFWPFGGYGYGPRGGCGGCIIPFVVVIIVIVIALVTTGVSRLGNSVRYGFSAFNDSDTTTYETNDGYDDTYSQNTASSSSGTSSTAATVSSREKADTGVAFTSDCILDELGWVEDSKATGESLEAFYEATGVQPYVYFKAYDASLTTDSEKEDYAFDWYEENINNEGTFLYIYFAEEDSDNDIGYMVYVNGYDIDSVMDEEAVNIFWNYVDEYWYSDLSTDDMLTAIFTSTADAIMN